MIMLMFGIFAHLLGLKYAKLCSFYTRVVRNCAWCRQFRDSSPLLMWSRKVSCLASTRTVTFSGQVKINEVFLCDSKMDQGFFQVSSFQPTIQSQRHMLPKRGPCLARHTSTSAGGSPAADSPPTRRRPAPASGPEAMPPRRSPRLVEDLHCNRPASQGNSSPAKSSARVKA